MDLLQVGARMFKSMTAEQYLDQRVGQFMKWYDVKAVHSKSRYLLVRTIAVAGAVLVPVLANVLPDYPMATRYVTTAASLVVSLALAIDTVFHYGDQWKNYRSSEQFLSREKFLFLTGEGPYREIPEDQAFIMLVERCEAQIAAENSATLNVIAAAQQDTAPTKPV